MGAKHSLKVLIGCAAGLLSAVSASAAPGVHASVEALLLAPKINSTGFENIFYEGVDFDNVNVEGNFEDALKGGVRFVLGKESCCGFGAQVRYFTYENSFAYDGLWDAGSGTLSVIGESEISVDAIDVELTQRGSFSSWDLVVTGGLRYGSVDISQPGGFFGGIPALIFAGGTGVEFEGVGPTFSLSAQRPVGHGLSVFGRARTALLFGDIDVTPGFRAGGVFTIENEFTQVWEFQFGLNYERELNNSTFVGGIFWEAQRWDSDSDFLGDLALHGLGLSGGFTY